jgi:hypothetical protein
MKRQILLLCLALLALISKAQPPQPIPVTDTQPLHIEGLEIGYNIKSEEVKEVGDKGNFSRFSVRFFVTNTTGQAKIMLYKQGLNLFNNVSDQVVQFNCLNATGARFTSKQATISAPACNVLALVDDKDPSGKTVQNKRFVQIGYWIQAGQTLSADVILIVPLNEKPNVQAIYLANMVQQPAMATIGNSPQVNYATPNQPPPPPVSGSQPFNKIRSRFDRTCINVEQGPVVSSPINGDQWSAQWQFIPVPGTNFFNIKNKWKLTYLNLTHDNLTLSTNFEMASSMWELIPASEPGTYLIKSYETHRYLCIVGNQLTSSVNPGFGYNSSWNLEQQQ